MGVNLGGENASELESAPAHSARALLESLEMAATMKGNYIKLQPELTAKYEYLVKKVQQSMHKITKHIKKTEPKVFEQLNQLELTDEQRTNILKVVGNMADDRVQKVGKELAIMAKDCKVGKSTFSHEILKRKLAHSFEQNKTKLAQLRNELLPAPLRVMVDNGWEATFDAERMRLVRNSKDSWDVEAVIERPTSRRLSDTSHAGSEPAGESAEESKFGSASIKSLGILTGVLEQARVALDQVDSVGESLDVDVKVPYWAKSLVGALYFVSELSDCALREEDPAKLMMCPLKYASAAQDFLSSIGLAASAVNVAPSDFLSADTTTTTQHLKNANYVELYQPQYYPQQGRPQEGLPQEGNYYAQQQAAQHGFVLP